MLERYHDDFNIEEVKSEVKRILSDNGVEAEVGETVKGMQYTIQTADAVLEVSLGDSWLGYELEVKESTTGKKIGASEDTDNYPLRGEYLDVTLAICDEILNCLKGLLEKRVYLGRVNGKLVLAIPVASEQYRLIVKGKIFSEVKSLEASELVNYPSLKPVN